MIRSGTHIANFLPGPLVLVLVWIACLTGYSQPDLDIGFKHIRYNPLDTPSSNLTSTIIQDERGYLWLGSMRGLHRYDGSSLKTYLTASDTFSLSSNSISVLHIDHTNRLWIGTRGGGINLYDPVHDRFLRDADPLSNDLVVWNIIN